jgi:hypothetical protein
MEGRYLHVLIIDESDALEILWELLRHSPITADSATTAEKALGLLGQFRWDGIFTL